MLTMLMRGCAFALGLIFTHPALAAWHEASSDHFVIYANDKEASIRQYAETLERYHAAMAFLLARDIEPPSPSNRVVIYAVGSVQEVQKLYPSRSVRVAGFYAPRAGASRAFVPNLVGGRDGDSIISHVLLHEYAHHFLISSTSFAMPIWFNEGAAEFFAATLFRNDGSVVIGRPLLMRAPEILQGERLTVRDLLAAGGGSRQYKSLYGYSWLLYHYLTFDPERGRQFDDYQINLMAGMSSLEAGEAAFGNLQQLTSEVQKYVHSRRMNTIVLPRDRLRIGEVKVRALPRGEAEMMSVIIRSQSNVTEEEAAKLVVKARTIAARHPDDPGVLTALAEAEHDAGHDEAAIAAADRALALDPSRTNAYIQKGLALFRLADKADDRDAAYVRAMQPFEQLNRIENDHPIALIYYYQGYIRRGVKPSENAKAGLQRALQLAPFDFRLRMDVAMMQLSDGKVEFARATLRPVAASPHGGRLATRAQQLIDRLYSLNDGVVPDEGQFEALAASGELESKSEADEEVDA